MPVRTLSLAEAAMKTPAFQRYIGIDYSGAKTPEASLKGLRVYLSNGTEPPEEQLPPPSPRKYWSRQELAEWLLQRLAEPIPSLVGIDHGFSFPLRYFEKYQLPPNWDYFLDDFQEHWPTDSKYTYVEFIRDGVAGKGAERCGSSTWRRVSEQRCGAKSVFHFDVPGSAAKSTHAGIPWLRYLRRRLRTQVHFWPFDGWVVPEGRSVLAEAYPSLWAKQYPTEGRTPDQHDAYVLAAQLSNLDRSGELGAVFEPELAPQHHMLGLLEGWILGVS